MREQSKSKEQSKATQKKQSQKQRQTNKSKAEQHNDEKHAKSPVCELSVFFDFVIKSVWQLIGMRD